MTMDSAPPSLDPTPPRPDQPRPDPDIGLAGTRAFQFALAQFPPLDAPMLAANDPQRLFISTPAAYGAYTYVLFGDQDNSTRRPLAWRHNERELLRNIETYVLKPNHSTARQEHVFLLPIHIYSDAPELAARTAPKLTRAARESLAAHLEHRGHSLPAARLRSGRGPFLITTGQPGLPPTQETSLLMVDLEGIGAESMYWVVDLYDRPLDPNRSPQMILTMLGSRLLAKIDNISEQASTAALLAQAEASWVFLIGLQQTATARPVL